MRSGLISLRLRFLPFLAAGLVSSGVALANDPTVVVRLSPSSADLARRIPVSPAATFDYPGFSWWLLHPADLARLSSHSIPHSTIPDAYRLTLGGRSFDPLTETPEHPAGWSAVSHPGRDLHLVQAFAPISGRWLDDLTTAGIEPVQYIHPFTYVVWSRASDLEDLVSLPWIRWTGSFAPEFRVLPEWRRPDVETTDLTILVVNHADLDGVVTALETLGATRVARAALDRTWTAVNARLPSEQLPAAAAVPGVFTIQPKPTDGGARGEMSNQVCAGNTDGGNVAFPGYLDWLDLQSLDGNGVVMANVDQGADQEHPDLVGRFLPCTGDTCGGPTSSTHGTHTAAIQAATGASGVGSLGFLRALGMAPGANLVEQLYFPFYSQPDGMLLLMAESFANGAVLSNNSWGPSGSPRGYDIDTKQTDIGVRDVDTSAAGNQALTYVLSIMNGYGGTSSQGTPDEGKNLITVGSTKMQDSNGSQLLDIDDLSANTAHGPALDGREIPHLVAPGCRVDSAVPTGYGLSCGTSMSSPHVSGSAALLVEQWRVEHGTDPSPAMIKAELLVAARDLAGNLDADGGVLGHPFDSKQGWGRLDTAATLDPATAKAVFDGPELLTETGDEWGTTLSVDSAVDPVKVMLVWTDAPGHGLGGATPAWNNDLDLLVEAGGVEYPGNNFGPDGWSAPGATHDGMNNTEGVFLPPGAAGEVTVRVRAANLNSDGVPGNAALTDQDFAVVVANAVPGSCVPGTFFHGDLTVTEETVDGAQTFVLEWIPATPRCGGSVTYVVNDTRSGEPGAKLAETGATAVTLVGASPGEEYCFTVGSLEDGAPGQSSDGKCVTGTAVRIAGDLDCNADLTSSDLEAVVATIFGAAEPSCAGFPAGDANLDGVIDSADLTQLVRAIDDPL
jgi:subtilisin family serine protease